MCYTCSLRKMNLIKSEIFRTIRIIRSVRRYEKVFGGNCSKALEVPLKDFSNKKKEMKKNKKKLKRNKKKIKIKKE